MGEKMEFVWGVLAGDEKGERIATLETVNEITLIRWTDTGEYTLHLDIGWDWEKDGALARMEELLGLFTAWMEAGGHDTGIKGGVFPEYTGRYRSIGQAYGHFRLAVLGLRASRRVSLEERLEEHYGRPVEDIARIPGGEEWLDFEVTEDFFSEGRGMDWLYGQAREISHPDALNLIRQSQSEDERNFWAYVADMNLQRAQREVIAQDDKTSDRSS